MSSRCTMPRPDGAADTRQVGAMGQDSIGQRAVAVARARMDRHSGRFIDDQHVLVLVHDIKGHGLRLEPAGRRLRDNHVYPLALTEPGRGLGRQAIYGNVALGEIRRCNRERDRSPQRTARNVSSRSPPASVTKSRALASAGPTCGAPMPLTGQ